MKPPLSSLPAVSPAATVASLTADNANLQRLLAEAMAQSRPAAAEHQRQTRQLELAESLGRTGSLVWRAGTSRVHSSAELRRLLNHAADAPDVSVRSLFRRVVPAHRGTLVRALRTALDAGFDRVARIDVRVGHALLQLCVAAFAERGETGAVTRLTLICRDESSGMSPAPAARAADHDTMLQRILDAAPDGLLVYDMRDQSIIDTNDRFCNLSGYSRQELIGKTEEQLYLWVDQDLRRQTYQAISEQRAHRNLEVVMRRRDGTTMETLIAVRALHADGTDLAVANVRDVSDYKQTLRALAESESRFAQAFKEAPLAALIVRQRDNLVLDVNNAYRAMMGGPPGTQPAEQTLTALLLAVAPDDRAAYLHACRVATEKLAVTFRHPSGKDLPTLVSSRLMRFRDDECAIVFLHDISARTDAEQRFAQALNTNPDGALLVRASDSSIIEVNDAFTQMSGYDRNTVIGWTVDQIGLWTAPELAAAFAAQLALGPVRDFGAPLKCRDGTTLATTISATRSSRGDSTWLLINLHDMSRERAAERVLRASQERFEQLFRTAPLAIGLYRVSDSIIVDVNPAFSAMFGRDAATLRGRRLDVRSMWPFAEQFEQFMSRLREFMEVRDFEATLDSNSGSFFALISARALRLDGALHVIFYVSNINAVKQMQEHLQHKQKMEAIGQLAGGVAHDFNNLLAGIQGFTELAMLQDELHETTRGYARQILATVQRAAQLTKQLLIFSRRDAPQLKPVDLHDVIHNVVAILEHAVDRRVQIMRHLASPNPTVLGDAAQIENAVLNLCINARDAMPDGGQITITTGLVILDADAIKQHQLDIPQGRYLRLTVSDTGTGIETAVLERMFDPFFTTKSAGHGTGLGLAAVWGMLRAHNGGIHVETALDVGTSFHLYFKPSAHTDATIEPPAVQQVTLGTGSILLVDDEATLRELVAVMLRTLGYEVVTAADGAAAMAHYEHHAPAIDLVLLDMTMPRMNGHDTLIAMQALNPQVRVLLMSGYAQSDELNDSLRRGALGVLHKPFDLSALSVHVSTALTKRKTIRR